MSNSNKETKIERANHLDLLENVNNIFSPFIFIPVQLCAASNLAHSEDKSVKSGRDVKGNKRSYKPVLFASIKDFHSPINLENHLPPYTHRPPKDADEGNINCTSKMLP